MILGVVLASIIFGTLFAMCVHYRNVARDHKRDYKFATENYSSLNKHVFALERSNLDMAQEIQMLRQELKEVNKAKTKSKKNKTLPTDSTLIDWIAKND